MITRELLYDLTHDTTEMEDKDVAAEDDILMRDWKHGNVKDACETQM